MGSEDGKRGEHLGQDINILLADSMRARIMQMERVLDAGMDWVRVSGL